MVKSYYYGGSNFAASLAIIQEGNEISGRVTYQGKCADSPVGFGAVWMLSSP